MKKSGILKLFIGVLATTTIVFSCQSDDSSGGTSEKREERRWINRYQLD